MFVLGGKYQHRSGVLASEVTFTAQLGCTFSVGFAAAIELLILYHGMASICTVH